MIKGKRYGELAVIILLLSFPVAMLSQQYGITITPGSSITAADGSEMTITDGSLVNDGTLIAQGESTVTFNGNTIQEIDGAVATTFSNLTVNNTAGLRIAGEVVSVRRMLLCNGLLETNGMITLLSGVDGTALINGTGSGTISGNVTMQRYLSSGFGYRYISSPFISSTVSELSDEAIESIYMYDEDRHVSGSPASGWANHFNPVNPLVRMHGYAVNFGAQTDPLTIDITGEVSNGDLSLPVYNHDQPYTTGFNLVGNPYPSPVDWNRINLLNTNIDDAVYYFSGSPADQYGGTYITYINGISSDGRATNVIPSMQGFFIHVTAGSWPVEGRLAMNNSVRINDLTHPIVKSATADPQRLIRLAATFSDNPGAPDRTVIYFDESATPEFDSQLDALKLMNTDAGVPNLFSVTPGASRLSINGMPPPGGKTLIVPLGIITQQDGTVKIQVSNLDPSIATMRIQFVDSLAGKRSYISVNSEYSVELKAGEHTGRFYLKFSEVSTAISRQPEDPGILEVATPGGMMRVKIASIEGPGGTLRIHDLTGRTLEEETINEPGYYDFPACRMNGIYIVTYRTGNVMTSKKVALLN